MTADLTLECGTYSDWVYFYAIPMLILWVCIIPTIPLLLLYKNRDQLEGIETLYKYGFLY